VCARACCPLCVRARRSFAFVLTEDHDADAADTYDSDTDAAAYGGDEL